MDTDQSARSPTDLSPYLHATHGLRARFRMDDTPTNPEPKKEFNKLDLSQLQSFSFGTQWTQDKPDTSGRPPRDREDRPRREGGGPGDAKRDRRGFKRPQGAPGTGVGEGGGPDRRSDPRDFRERREGAPGGPREHGTGREGGRPPFRGGPRREGPGGGFGRGPQERGPYISPYFTVTFYPEDTSFAALAKTIRASCRTFELFDIAKTVIGKNDRFVVVVQRKTPEGATGAPSGSAAPAAGAAEATRQPLYVSVPDGLLFDSEEAAVNHVLQHHLDRFFDAAEVEVDPPKGSFQVINKCGVTGELLGPPNYHRYQQTVQQHHATRLPRMPFEVFRARIESVRDPEVVNQWLERMKKVTRYTWKGDKAGAAAGSPAPAPAAPASADAEPAEGTTPANDPAETLPPPPAAGPVFDALSEARVYLLTHAREKVVRAVEHGRFHGRALEQLPDGEIKRAVEGALERQRRFPLDTANALRGRLRREGFTIFKKGSKGISYVCAVKRKFRVPGQTFAESIGQLIAFIEEHPMVKASELPQKFLGLSPTPSTPEHPLPLEDQQRLSRLQGDLRWLVTEGYVTEFIDGSLFAPPPMVEARKRELESGEGDPENFPDRPATAPEPAAPAAETAEASAPSPAAPAAAEPTPAESATGEPAAPAEPEPEAVRPAADETPPVQPEMPAPAEPAPVESAEPEANPSGEKPAS